VAAPAAAPVPVAVAGAQSLPSTSTGDPLGPLAMLGIALTSIGILLLARKPVRHP
jgi:LPXTG-motif cell wall-anchored protein